MSHRYTQTTDQDNVRWYVDNETGKQYLSVTEILSAAVPKHLTKWYKNNSQRKIETRLRESRDHGTKLHSIIEAINRQESPVIPVELMPFVTSYKALCEDNKITCEYPEKIVVSEKYGYAGRTDMIGTYKGKPTVMDLKTGRHFDIKTGWQLAAYKHAAEEMNLGVNFGMAGIHVPSDGRAPNVFAYEHLDFCWQRFLDALGVYKGLYFAKLKSKSWPYLNQEAR